MYRLAAALIVIAIALVVVASAHAFPGRNGAVVFSWSSNDEPELGTPTFVRAIKTAHSVDARRAGGDAPTRTVIGCRFSDSGPLGGDCTNPVYANPAFSPDGKLVVFDAGPSLAIREVRRGAPLTLLPAHGSGDRDDGDPAFSPDGKRLVFTAGGGVWICDLDGGSAHEVIPDAEAPAWSTRNWIAFVRDGGVWRVRPDGSGLRRLSARGLAPAWSPHGTRIAFVHRQGSLWTMHADGSQPRRVPGTSAANVAWSPDGTQLVIHIFDGGVWALRTDGSHAREVVSGGVNATSSFDAGGVDWQPLR